MQTAVLCYAQPLNNWIYTAYDYFLRLPLSMTPIGMLSVKKDLKFRMNSIRCKIFKYIHKNLFAPQAPDFLEKLADNFHGEHILLKLKIKRLLRNMSSKNLTVGV